MPGQDKAYLIRELERALGRRRMASGDYEIRIRHFFPATTSPVDTPLWKAMEKAGRVLVDGTMFVNGLLTGATDSRFFRHHCGAIAYGTSLFQPELTLDKLMKSIHGDNERISVASLGISVQYFVLTILYMLGAAEEAS
jgi:acetylornithine deacetylase/succinyl-diaminopimelate desuccinylase-like protein